MNFRDVYVRKEERFSIGVEVESGKYYVSFPVRNQFVDYEEFYEIDRAQFNLFQTDLEAAMEFVKAARERHLDDRLIEEPGRLRGWAT